MCICIVHLRAYVTRGKGVGGGRWWKQVGESFLWHTNISALYHITFHRTGLSLRMCSVMSSSKLYVLTTVFTLKATLYLWHHPRIFINLSTWLLFPCRRPIALFVSSSNESHEMARMSRHWPAIISINNRLLMFFHILYSITECLCPLIGRIKSGSLWSNNNNKMWDSQFPDKFLLLHLTLQCILHKLIYPQLCCRNYFWQMQKVNFKYRAGLRNVDTQGRLIIRRLFKPIFWGGEKLIFY